jgi:multidrug efflux pump subunit AcrB
MPIGRTAPGCDSRISTILPTRRGERGRSATPSPAAIIPRRVPWSIPSKAILGTNIFTRFQRAFEGGFEKLRTSYRLLLTKLVLKRKVFVPAFLGVCLCAFLLMPWLGQDFFPNTDSGEFILHVRGKTGLRIEDQARLCDLVENVIRREIPEKEVGNILDNIGPALPRQRRNRSISSRTAMRVASIPISRS